MKKILLADTCTQTLKEITSSSKATSYEILCVNEGNQCLQAVETSVPDLILLDLFLPKMHGIELLKTIKALHPQIGIIITSYQPMIQNYHGAKISGADYFLLKPFSPHFFFELVEKFFNHQLMIEPFNAAASESDPKTLYTPTLHSPLSYLKFWGTRGSVAVAGPEYVKYGGNTSCLEVREGKDLLIIDAGTGIRALGNTLSHIEIFHLFISHTHWDHITGFPFFEPLYKDHVEIHIYAPVGFEKDVKELFVDMIAYTYFPVRLDQIKAKIHFHSLRDGDHIQIGALNLSTHYAVHPGSTLCFKIKTPKITVGYVTDNEFLMGYLGHPNALSKIDPLLSPYLDFISFFSDCEMMIHEAQYSAEEYKKKIGWGHSSTSNASILIKYIKCKQWIVTHHEPEHTDQKLLEKYQLQQDILKDCEIDCNLRFAQDGLIIPL